MAVEVVKFISSEGGYHCNKPGDKAGEYVSVFDFEGMEARASSAESSLAAMRRRYEAADGKYTNAVKSYIKDTGLMGERIARLAAERDAMRQRTEVAEAKVAEAVKCSRAQANNFFEMKWRAERAEEALREAASSLETISVRAGNDEYMKDLMQVRQYANSRATVAHSALSSPPADASTMGGEKCHPYDYCPICGAPGIMRERRPNGDDKCANGHTYPSRMAITAPVSDQRAGYRASPALAPSDHISQPGKMVGERERHLEQIVEDAYKEGLWDGVREMNDAYNGHCAPNEKALWERSDARAALADMEQKS